MIGQAGAPAIVDQAQERKTKMSQDKATYEGMFLLDAGNPDFQAASEPVRNILDRNEATTLAIKLWDERRLAYEIQGKRRGLYVLSYFASDPARIAEIERDCRLDERILRVLLLRRDGLTEEQIQAETPASGGARRQAERREGEPDTDGADLPDEEMEVEVGIDDEIEEEVGGDDN
jgi:small subunit ribosomal protein S6